MFKPFLTEGNWGVESESALEISLGGTDFRGISVSDTALTNFNIVAQPSIPAIFEGRLESLIAAAMIEAVPDSMQACGCGLSHDGIQDVKDAISHFVENLDEALATGEVAQTYEGVLTYAAELIGVEVPALEDGVKSVIEARAEVDDTLYMDSIAGDSSTTATLTVGSTVSGTRETGEDADWFRVDLVAGTDYTFIMLRDGDNPHRDPLLQLYDTDGTTLLDTNDDIDSDGDGTGDNQNSMITFTATQTGTYFISAEGYRTQTGDYTVYLEEGNNRPDFTLAESANFLINQFSNARAWEQTDLTYDVSGIVTGRQTLAIQAMQAWAEVSGLTFTAAGAGETADIIFKDNEDDGGAFARSTLTNGFITSVTVNVDADWQGGSNAFDSYTYQTFVHEVGHALGLGHGGPYNGDASGSDRVYNQDAWNYTVMSYFDQIEAGTGSLRNVLGLQVVDVLAIQTLYGTATDARVGDTVYGFNSNAGGIYDFTTFTDSRPPSVAIFDSDGIDTLDVSLFNTSQVINLNAGTFSSIGDNTLTSTQDDPFENVLSIAVGVDIENINGGGGSDQMFGNALDNEFTGYFGNDFIDGGAGTDVAIYSREQSRYNVTDNGDGTWTVQGLAGTIEGTDTLTNIETLRFSDGEMTIGADTGPTTFTEQSDDGRGTDQDDIINALGGDDIVDAMAGNDTVYGSFGNDIINGGAGNDTILGDNAILLTGVEGEVFRAYQAVFDRAPDLGGFNAFTTEIRLGNLTQEDVIAEFVASTEFQNTYGTLTNRQFMEQLYLNVLDREGDAEGLNNFTTALDNGVSRASVVVDFAESLEFLNLITTSSAAFATNVTIDPVQGQVFRIYQAVFDRAPDFGGFTAFVNSIQANVLTVEEVTAEFVGSQEFQDQYGSLSNTNFVEALYTNVLPGNTDQQGRVDYVNALDAGTLTRAAMVAEFVESFEFRQAQATAAADYVESVSQDPSDSIEGGTGNDVMFGGFGADTFLFDGTGTGEDIIMDFTAGTDTIAIENVAAFDSFAEVSAAMTQVGADVLITLASGDSIRLSNVDMSTLTADSFDFGGSASAQKPPSTPVAETLDDLTASIFDDGKAAQDFVPVAEAVDADALMFADIDASLQAELTIQNYFDL